MKKRIIIAAAITACLALCAAMWPQAETVGETPAVIVPEAAVVELKTEAETALPSEKEKTAIPQPEQTQEAVTEPKSAPAETPAVQSAPEPEPVPEVSYGLAPEQAAEPHVVLTTAEDIVAVVDAVIAKGSEAAKDFIAEFTGIATDDQVLKALQMACELQLIVFDSSRGCYGSPSFLARKLVSASSDEQKAVFMRLILEQYAPYNTFKTRYGFTKSIELACRQTKTLHMMTSNERDVKNTLISIATYAKALKSEGANLYSFVEDVDAVGIIEAALRSANITENSLRTYWGENLYTFVNTSNVFAPLVEALQKTHSGTMDVRSIVVCAANAFESFLADFAVRKGVSLSGRNGILQKRDALSAHISKKHRGMIEFVGQVRNAADHGADPDENNQVWTISNETARIYPCIIAALIKAIFSRDATGSIEV